MKIGNFFEKSDTLIVLTLRASYWGTKQVVCCFCRASWAKLSSSSFNLFTFVASGVWPWPNPATQPTYLLPAQKILVNRVSIINQHLLIECYFPECCTYRRAVNQYSTQLKSEFVFWPIFTTLTRQNHIPYCLKIMLKCLIFEQKKFKCFCPSKKIGYMAS